MPKKTETTHIDEAREKILDAVLPHVAFDGWSNETLNHAVAEAGIDPGLAHLAFPRGGVDMALAFHYRADQQLKEALSDPAAVANLASMRIRDRITYAVRRRIELVAGEREAVRRGATLLALPIYASEGVKAIWNTADVIWSACGDTADDYNWYTKRMILSSVYSATVLYWLGDQSNDSVRTWEFLDRRIGDVMTFEKTKASLNKNPLIQAAMWGPNQLLSRIKAPRPGT
ncbi:COQ9 family protein [Rhodobacteraceae bacterium NNCM2]|nr:COQ9 family protein [Coraliihabitans acroporae]